MDNHVHFVLYGTLKECCEFRDRFAHKYSLWYHNRYSCRTSEPIDFDIKLMDDEKYILNSIAYVLKIIRGHLPSLLTIRKRREMFQTMNDIPGEWKVTPEGVQVLIQADSQDHPP